MLSEINTIFLSASAYLFLGETNSDTPLLRAWEEWAKQAPGTGECRDIAVRRLKNTLTNGMVTLDLSFLQLTQLPEQFPPGLQHLDVSYNCLISLPTSLPDSLITLDVSYNHLESLPAHLPVSLVKLYAGSNWLKNLPAILPNALKSLYVGYNQLESLPDNLPALFRLYVHYNRLMSLPVTLPNSLEKLDVAHNQLTNLPECLPVSLTYLNANSNWLTALPAMLPGFLETLQVDDNPLASHCWERMDFFTKLRGWQPKVNIARWQNIYTEDHVGDFVTFLDKLHQGNNRSSAALRGQVGRWLDYLVQDGHGKLRQQTFVLANEAAESCVDRASYYFTLMQILFLEHQLLNRNNPSPEEVVKAVQGNFRLQTLNEIASRQVAARRAASPGFAEDLEIYLAYQYKLREPLALPVYAELQFSEIAGLTDEDVRQAKETVAEAEKADFMRYWLTQSALWGAILAKWDGAKKAAVDAQYVADIDKDNCKFNAEVDKRLRDLGIAVNDADARHGVSTQLADELLYTQRYQLTQEYLAEKQALSLLERFDSATL